MKKRVSRKELPRERRSRWKRLAVLLTEVHFGVALLKAMQVGKDGFIRDKGYKECLLQAKIRVVPRSQLRPYVWD